jgi:hypothetical protein
MNDITPIIKDQQPLFYLKEDEFRQLMKGLLFEFFEQWKKENIPNEISSELLTKKDVQSLFRVSAVTIREWVKCGFLPEPIRKKRRVYFLKSAVTAAFHEKNICKNKR